MFGPGEYVAEQTEGITRVEDLPKAKLVRRSRNYKRRPCPLCEHRAYRLRTVTRTLHDLGDSIRGRPRDIVLTYSQHRCPKCNHYFNADMDDLALPKSHYTHRVVSPNLEKALTFLDDSLLPATSNAVERANRRHRKMQKSIYCVRTRDHISQRIAVDMQRDLYIGDQKTTINTLHWSRSGGKRKTG
jgi:hypothetical protein